MKVYMVEGRSIRGEIMPLGVFDHLGVAQSVLEQFVRVAHPDEDLYFQTGPVEGDVMVTNLNNGHIGDAYGSIYEMELNQRDLAKAVIEDEKFSVKFHELRSK